MTANQKAVGIGSVIGIVVAVLTCLMEKGLLGG